MKRAYPDRARVIIFIFVSVVIIYWIRLFYIQIIDSSYREGAESNALRKQTQYPARGLVYDRFGKLLVYNEAVYDLIMDPAQAKETDIDELCRLIEIDQEGGRLRYEKARKFSKHTPSVFEKQISKEVYGRLQEQLFKFPGFYVQSRTLRKYPQPIAAHVLGYIGEVSTKQTKDNPYYKSGDYIGMSGLERQYEEVLRGKKGCKLLMVDVLNREKGSYRDGAFDTVSTPGFSLYSTLDMELQAFAETLMKNKRGSIVAIEPETGEILALVSSPGYDPNLLVGRVRSANYAALLEEPAKPLFDRTLMAYYPPGSIFKIPQALIALQEGVIDENTAINCDRSLVGCHDHPSATNVAGSLRMSCNPYYYVVYRKLIMQGKDPNRFKDSRIGLEKWEEYMKSFGFGTRLGIDLPNAKAGLVPNVAYFDRYYGKEQWAFSTIYSLSIGQGEVGLIPLQMANLAAIVANRGYYKTPHLVRYIGEKKMIPQIDTVKHYVKIDQRHFAPIIEGMYGAVHEPGGTARRARLDTIMVCGKTGTSQNPHGKDHAVFIAFAPKDNPKIAISVFIENSGFGGTWSAPVAGLLIEYYLTRQRPRPEVEKQIVEATFSPKEATKKD